MVNVLSNSQYNLSVPAGEPLFEQLCNVIEFNPREGTLAIVAYALPTEMHFYLFKTPDFINADYNTYGGSERIFFRDKTSINHLTLDLSNNLLFIPMSKSENIKRPLSASVKVIAGDYSGNLTTASLYSIAELLK